MFGKNVGCHAAQLIERRPVYRRFVLAAADPGLTPCLGPFATSHECSQLTFVSIHCACCLDS